MNRDLRGYADYPPIPCWPHGARVAVNFVMNYEEGAERTPLNGDTQAETYGGEFPLTTPALGLRHLGMESLFEYGSRTGVWRLLRLFKQEAMPLTFFATGLALQLNPELCDYLRFSDYDIAGHGWRWIDYASMPRAEEKKHISQCVKTIQQLTGHQPQGWYTGRRSENTRALLREIGGFVYDSDSYADDLPYFDDQHLIIPYTLVCNDFRYLTTPGFASAHDFYLQLKNTLDYLYQDNRPALMTIGLHARISGHPARCLAVKHFMDYLRRFPDLWITRRIDVAHYWLAESKAKKSSYRKK